MNLYFLKMEQFFHYKPSKYGNQPKKDYFRFREKSLSSDLQLQLHIDLSSSDLFHITTLTACTTL